MGRRISHSAFPGWPRAREKAWAKNFLPPSATHISLPIEQNHCSAELPPGEAYHAAPVFSSIDHYLTQHLPIRITSKTSATSGILRNLEPSHLGITTSVNLIRMATETPTRTAVRSSPAVKSSALKSILRTGPTTLGRRARDDDDETPPPQSPTKRRKTVVFDMESNTVQSIGSQSPEESRRKVECVKHVVLKALKEHTSGDQEGYDTLKGIFRNDRRRKATPNSTQVDDEIEPSELIYYIVALKACAPHIGRSCAGLVHEVLSIPWLGRPDDFVTAYIDFLANLVTGQSIFLSNVLSMLVEKFRHFKTSQWEAGDFPEVSCDVMRQRLHRALGQVLQLFPAARRVLLSQINKDFPFSDDAKPVHMAFVQNLLRLREYAPDMGPEIMELITDRLVKVSTPSTSPRSSLRLYLCRSTYRSKLTSMRPMTRWPQAW